MIRNYQQEKALEPRSPEAARLATVANVGYRGLQVIFDGETQPDGKYYLCSQSLVFREGDRVLVEKISGSYVVVCRIGAPIGELDFSGKYVGVGPWQMTKASGTIESATSRINRIIDALKAFGMAY